MSRGLRRRRPNGPWYARYLDATGRRRERNTGTTDKRTAERIVAQWSTDAALRRAGIIDARAEEASTHMHRPVRHHLRDWQQHLEAQGSTQRHVALVTGRARKLLQYAGARTLADCSSGRIVNGLRLLQAEFNLSAQTYNFYGASLLQFGRWLVRAERCHHNPFSHIPRKNVALDRRRARRALTLAELQRLYDATSVAPFRGQLAGRVRTLLYRTAADTGLRAAELRSLTRASFDLSELTITVEAAYSKHRRRDLIPIRPVLVDHLRAHLASLAPNDPVFPATRHRRVFAEMFRADLLTANIPQKTDQGVVDFHALRHTFITLLVRGGAGAKSVQTLARHSTISLTMDRYIRLVPVDARAALDALDHQRHKTQGESES